MLFQLRLRFKAGQLRPDFKNGQSAKHRQSQRSDLVKLILKFLGEKVILMSKKVRNRYGKRGCTVPLLTILWIEPC